MGAAESKDQDNTEKLLYIEYGSDYRGYRKEYLARSLTPREEGLLICKVCNGIMRKASIICGTTTCLLCSQSNRYQSNPVRIKLVDDCVNNLEIKCPLFLRKCTWNGKLSEAEKHVNNCPQFMIECTDCLEIVSRGEMNAHTKNSCRMRLITCEHCQLVMHAFEMEDHLKICQLFPVLCPNNCKKKMSRMELSSHNPECPLVEVACPYTKYGCEATPLRKDLLSHKKEFIVEHMDMVETENQNLKVKVNWLTSEIKTMKRLDGVEWELRNLHTLKQGNRVDGPTFPLKGCTLKCSFRVEAVLMNTYKLKFFVKKMQGEQGKNTGKVSINKCQFTLVDDKDSANSKYEDISMHYDLTIGENSMAFHTVWISPEDVSGVRMYFDSTA